MKKIFLVIFLTIFGITSQSERASAQISVRINIGNQPMWGPYGYDYVEYYYLPEIDVYYYVPGRQFIYFENGHWVRRHYLPKRYRGFDLYSAIKYIINESRPYHRHDYYKSRFLARKDHRHEITIRDYRDRRNHERERDHYDKRRDKREHDNREYVNRKRDNREYDNKKREHKEYDNRKDNNKREKKGRENSERRESARR
ncbi:MAG: hypothetical protein AB9922_12580 [Bacteroidales bacterium]